MPDSKKTVAIIGGGPAGLMAAEVVAGSGTKVSVDIYDAMPSVGRKFLMAGKGGLNLTHAEPMDRFASRYGERRAQVEPWLAAFGPGALRDWTRSLGIETFVGSSQRVFPAEMKAAPLLRAWIRRLREAGVMFHMRHRWLGWSEAGALRFSTEKGEALVRADAVVLALGGGSWARLGSDGAWTSLLATRGVPIAPLRPANCGFDYAWSTHLRTRYAGQPLKSVIASFTDNNGKHHRQQGECILTDTGIEGGVIYALSAPLRDTIDTHGSATLHLDLAPGRDLQRLTRELSTSRGKRSLSNHLQNKAGIAGVKAALLRERASTADLTDSARLAALIKTLPLQLTATRPLDEAISSAGGVCFDALTDQLMLRKEPGVFCAGEMLDWEARTGGYLLTACFASGRVAGAGVVEWLRTSS
ncbi:MAG TPA: TIGR03862 family flavoprotein [Burkholderiales bacterium]|nr:TIGR03862 family flavoprotein [Burkholderiales bacterium]